MPPPLRRGLLARLALVVGVFGLGLLLSLAVGLGSGAVHLSLRDVAAACLGHWWPGGGSVAPDVRDIVWEVRLPRVLLGAGVGASLSVAGTALQGLFGNPLADPYVAGVSSGAALGAASAILLGWSGALAGMAVPACAFAAALLTLVLVVALARSGGQLSARNFLLAGVVVGSFLWSLVTLALTLSGQDLQQVLLVLMGSLSASDWPRLTAALPFGAVACLGLWALARDLDLISIGEEPAHHLGVSVEAVKWTVVGLAALATAAAVAVSGIIGFVGLIVPHTARSLVGPDHRVLIPASALLGAAFLVLADTAARTVLGATELPVGVVTALLGGPFFCYLLKTRWR